MPSGVARTVEGDERPFSFDGKTTEMRNFFKVPGKWPSNWKGARNGFGVWDAQGRDHFGADVDSINGAWYARTVEIPSEAFISILKTDNDK